MQQEPPRICGESRPYLHAASRRQAERVTPHPVRCRDALFHHLEMIDVDVEGVFGAGLVHDFPFLGGAELHRMIDSGGVIRPAVNQESAPYRFIRGLAAAGFSIREFPARVAAGLIAGHIWNRKVLYRRISSVPIGFRNLGGGGRLSGIRIFRGVPPTSTNASTWSRAFP